MARAGAQHELAPRWLRAPGEFETRTLTLALTLALALALALALTPTRTPTRTATLTLTLTLTQALLPSARYALAVQAINSVGHGPASEHAAFETAAAAAAAYELKVGAWPQP